MRVDENDLSFDFNFFRSRGKIKNPRGRKKTVAEQKSTPVKHKTRGWGNAYQNTRTGTRPDLGSVVVRSGWEADMLRILILHKIPFEFESVTFSFPPDSRGRMQSYLPDIYLPLTDEYIEVKGYLDSRGRNKLRKFKKNYPDEFSRLTVIISKSNKPNKQFFQKLNVKNILYYEHLSRLYKEKIPTWEGK